MKLRASFSILALTAATAAIAQTSTTGTPAPHAHHAAAASSATTLPKNIPPAHGLMHTAYALKYIDTKIGTGGLAVTGKFYTVQYTGWLAADGKKFDSSYDHGAPITFPVGAHRVIPGWDTGFAGMKIGGKRRLFIPYQLAYGEPGRGPIPPKADLIFDIELVSISDKPPAPPKPPVPPAGTPAAPGSAPGSTPGSAAPNATPPPTPPTGTSAPSAPATPPPASSTPAPAPPQPPPPTPHN